MNESRSWRVSYNRSLVQWNSADTMQARRYVDFEGDGMKAKGAVEMLRPRLKRMSRSRRTKGERTENYLRQRHPRDAPGNVTGRVEEGQSTKFDV